jgi:hypothetical protein
MSAVDLNTSKELIAFPSLRWFQRLAELMNNNRARQEQLGYVDCVAQFTIDDGAANGGAVAYRIAFEEFSAVDVREVPGAELGNADFSIDGPLAIWSEMIESIAAGGCRPDLEQTLNRLTHMGTQLRLRAPDAIHADYYFRFNQSLQEFINASGLFATDFAR